MVMVASKPKVGTRVGISAASYRILTCTRVLRAQFIITAASTLERKERTTATPEFSDEWLILHRFDDLACA